MWSSYMRQKSRSGGVQSTLFEKFVKEKHYSLLLSALLFFPLT